MCTHKQRGFSAIGLLVAMSLMASLFIEGLSFWQRFQISHAKQVLYKTIANDLSNLKLDAFTKGETLTITPKRWQTKQIKLIWHGFLKKDALVISHSPAHLAMNGYFLVETKDGAVEKWVVSRFGSIYRKIY